MDHNTLAETFVSFGMNLGRFLKPFVSDFHADAVLITGGIAEAWERFGASLIESLAVPVLKGQLGKTAALLGAAALYFQQTN
jgi:glucokinase